MLRTLALVAAGLSAGLVAAADDKDKKTGTPADNVSVAAKLEGTYVIVSGEKDGNPIPEADIKGSKVAFTKERIVGTDKDKKDFFAATYTLDTATKPYRIKMKSETAKPDTPKAETEVTGIIELTDTGVRICYHLPGGTEPTEFKTKDKQLCFVLKRAE